MKQLSEVKFSTLDLVPVRADGNAAQSLRNSLDLAQHVENTVTPASGWPSTTTWTVSPAPRRRCCWGIWRGTSTIRVGSGGVMLPNHAPLIIAEQFGTLESLYPGRIDLGLGRAPGSDQMTARALRRERSGSADDFLKTWPN